ncbi:MAG TPA: glycoside hydrolase family 15 protein [Gaiellales bacterium]|jgi:GH15 family glucan-1,4-alpha-glucosidase|nr:glycoside hydrolase family 15 protein [Gaiellales bacterium]
MSGRRRRTSDRKTEHPHPAIADYAFLSDRRTACLVSRSGSVDWWCVPRIDASSTFGALLDSERGGHMSMHPTAAHEIDREYLEDTLVLRTRMRTRSGEVELTDLLALRRDGAAESDGHLIRLVEGRRGTVRMTVEIAPRFDYGEVRPWVRRDAPDRHVAIGGDDALAIWSDVELEAAAHDLRGAFTLTAGERACFSLRFVRPHLLDAGIPDVDAPRLEALARQTAAWWRRWLRDARAPSTGPRDRAVRISAMTLEGLANGETGAIAAAATTSLPEVEGGGRNWDYRFSWIRDSTLAARALAELGFDEEADTFRRFIQRSSAGHVDELQIAYGVGGERRLVEYEVDLAGYGGAAPVRVGNAAALQRQNDVLGELALLAWRWHRRGHSPDDDTWRFICDLADAAAARWSEPDAGIWELRDRPARFVHSTVMCWAALDRALALADECMRRGPVRRWKRERDRIARAVERHGYDRRRNTFRRAFDSDDVDAALLLLPHTGFVEVADERMVGTVAAVVDDLDDRGLLRRYRAADGLPGREGAFVACTFWLAECLAGQGRLDDATTAFRRAAATANDLGLFSEEYDPRRERMLGNFPQALTHLSHIAAASAIARHTDSADPASATAPAP